MLQALAGGLPGLGWVVPSQQNRREEKAESLPDLPAGRAQAVRQGQSQCTQAESQTSLPPPPHGPLAKVPFENLRRTRQQGQSLCHDRSCDYF